MKVKVFVKLKDAVLDPQGQTILSSINRMGMISPALSESVSFLK